MEDSTSRFRKIVEKWDLLPPPGIAASASLPGPRTRNEDCAGTARIGDCLFAVAADGMGGLPDGNRASLSACCHALTIANRKLEHFPGGAIPLQNVVHGAFERARRMLQKEGRRRGYRADRPGYGTTLLVVLADPYRYAYGYIGDGMILIRRADGTVRQLNNIHRVPGRRSVLCRMLGATPIGKPQLGVIPRQPGDLLLLGTDGLWDIVPPENFAHTLHRIITPPIQGPIESALAEVSSATDEIGPVCDDNLSLVALRTPGNENDAI